MALSFLPMMGMVGAAVDYGRALATGSQVQAAVDSAALAAAAVSSSERASKVSNVINAALAGASNTTLSTPSVSAAGSDGSFMVSVTASVPTRIITPLWTEMSVTRTAKVIPGTAGTAEVLGAVDNSCIFTTGEMLALSNDVMVFNGSPSVNLSGCSIRSNKSIKCNGGNVGANQAYAVGNIDGSCTNPASNSHPGQPAMPDMYSTLVSNISFQCGTTNSGVTWTSSASGGLPTGTNVKTVAQTGYSEIHICGDLTLSGASANSLTGAAPTTDTVVIIENGGLIVSNNAAVKANRVTFVLASGSSLHPPIVTWPSGTGQAATLTISSSTATANPWRGMAIYQTPTATFDTYEDNWWKPGGNIVFDGILYFPNAQLTVSGNMSVGPVGCAKIVSGEFTLNGNVSLSQTTTACATQGVTQYTWPGTPAVASTSTRLVN